MNRINVSSRMRVSREEQEVQGGEKGKSCESIP